MQAIEFETHLENGLIHLPVSYQHWQEGKHVKVIVLVDSKRDGVCNPVLNVFKMSELSGYA
jgi:hypothetical protein